MSIEDKYLNEKDNFDFEGYFNDMLSNQKHSTKIKKLSRTHQNSSRYVV